MKRFVVLFGVWMLAAVPAGCEIDEGPDRGPGLVGVGEGSGGSAADGEGGGGGSDSSAADDGGAPDQASGGDAGAPAPTDGGGSGGAGAGTGGSGGSGGAPVGVDAGGGGLASVCDGAGTRVLTAGSARIDNFEGGALNPGWSTFSDVAGAQNVARMTIQNGGAAGTAHAGHYAGSGARTPAMGGYGVGAVFNVAIDKAHGLYCADVSAFDGVSFWARANRASATSNGNQLSVNFILPETNAVSVGGDCPDASMKCYNHPRKSIMLTDSWTQYTVTFAEATGGSASVHGRVQALAFLSPDSSWDYSIDELQLYKGTPPGGPAGP